MRKKTAPRLDANLVEDIAELRQRVTDAEFDLDELRAEVEELEHRNTALRRASTEAAECCQHLRYATETALELLARDGSKKAAKWLSQFHRARLSAMAGGRS